MNIKKRDSKISVFIFLIALSACSQNLEKRLVNAVHTNNIEEVEKLIKKNVNVNIADTSGNTPLHTACELGYENIAEILLKNGASLERLNFNHKKPVELAKSKGFKNIVEILEKCEKIKSPLNRRLFEAIKEGNLNKVMALIDDGADINARKEFTFDTLYFNVISLDEHSGETALHSSANEGYAEIVKLLIEKGADINAESSGLWNKDKLQNTPLHRAVFKGHSEIIKLLLENGANYKKSGFSDLWSAILIGDKNKVSSILNTQTDINITENYKPLLCWASMSGNMEIFKLLVNKGVDINEKDNYGKTPLHWADNLEITKILIEKSADIYVTDIEGNMPFHTASIKGKTEIVKLLIDKGVDINTKNNEGETALHLASENGYIDIVKLLIEKGADVNSTDKIETPAPLQLASSKGHTEIVKLLIKNGARVNEYTGLFTKYNTPLNESAYEGHSDIVKLLIENSADVNMKDIEGWTALHFASERGHTEIAKLLIENGADINAKTGNIRIMRMIEHTRDGEGYSLFNPPKYIVEYNVYTDEILSYHIIGGKRRLITKEFKWTPLHIASYYGHIEIVKLLIENGADINAKDIKRKTAIDRATKTSIINLLKEHIVKNNK